MVELTATAELAAFVADTRSDAIPEAAMAAAKVAILDGIGNLIAGSGHPVAQVGRQFVARMGGRCESTAVGHSEKLPASLAAWVNGLSLHCLDFEVQGIPPTHGTSTILPAVLALGEKRGATGREALAAFVIGWEVQQRIRLAGAEADLGGFHYPGVIGPLAAAAAAARMLAFSDEQVRSSFGVAASRTGGLFANNGTMTKATHPANAARAGVESVQLVDLGFTSSESVLEGATGYVNAVFRGTFNWSALTNGLGMSFQIVDPGFNIKHFPAEIYMQWVIEAAAELRARRHFEPADVSEVIVEPPVQRGYLSRPTPASGLDGKFSYEYCATVGLIEPRVTIGSFTDRVRFSEAVEAMLPKVTIDEQTVHPAGELYARVTVRTADGDEYSVQCDHFIGSIRNPMPAKEHHRKIVDCFASVDAEDRASEIIAVVSSLDDCQDIGELTRLLQI